MTLTVDQIARFRTACLTDATMERLSPELRGLWAAIVSSVTNLAEDPACGMDRAQADLALRLRDLGARPADYLAMHGLFDAAIAGADLQNTPLAALEVAIDATLTGFLTEAYGLRAQSIAMAA